MVKANPLLNRIMGAVLISVSIIVLVYLLVLDRSQSETVKVASFGLLGTMIVYGVTLLRGK